METHFKIVEFDKFCKTCEHKDLPESESPCWDCLTESVNEDSHRPVKYKEAEKK